MRPRLSMQGDWYTIDEQVRKVRRPYAQTPLSPFPLPGFVFRKFIKEDRLFCSFGTGSLWPKLYLPNKIWKKVTEPKPNVFCGLFLCSMGIRYCTWCETVGNSRAQYYPKQWQCFSYTYSILIKAKETILRGKQSGTSGLADDEWVLLYPLLPWPPWIWFLQRV